MGRHIARLRLAGVKVVSLFFGDLLSCEGRGLRRVPCLYELEEQLRLLRSRMTNLHFSIFKTSAGNWTPLKRRTLECGTRLFLENGGWPTQASFA